MSSLSAAEPLAVFDWHWHPQPGVIDGVFVLTVLYAVAVGPARRYLTSTGSISRWQILSFAVAQILLFLAIASPLDQISEQYLFSAHMLQHVILIYPVPLLWLWGTPDWIWRIPLQMEAFAPIVKFVTRPQVAFILFNFIFYVWHLPPMYEWALRDSKIHFLEHATFMGGALLLWWPLVQPLKELPRFHPDPPVRYLGFLSRRALSNLPSGPTALRRHRCHGRPTTRGSHHEDNGHDRYVHIPCGHCVALVLH
jgi:putative membrane protein